jgi:ParB/RepB/Spo0J family partition protein
MGLDNEQGHQRDGPVESSSASTPDANGAASDSAAEPKRAAKQKIRTKTDAKPNTTLQQLPNGCTLSAAAAMAVADLVITQYRDEGEEGKTRLCNLAMSMKLVGQLYPLIVRFNPTTGKYEVVAGNRRAAAALLGGIPTLMCSILECPDEAIQHVIAAVENAHREEEAPLSLALKIKAAIKAGYSQKQAAELFGKSKPAVCDMYYAATKLPAKDLKRIENGEGLYKVVAEHRKRKTDPPIATNTETLADNTTIQDSPEAPATPAGPEAPKEADTPAAQPQAGPTVRYQYDRHDLGDLTITLTGTSKQKPPAADMAAALRHVLGHYETNREPT